MFKLTNEEFVNWKSQTVISNSINMGLRHKPYVFTELGVAMLSSVLNSPTAIQINIGIMRAFVAIRQKVLSPDLKVSELQVEIKNLKEYIEDVFSDYIYINEETQMQIELINKSLAELHSSKSKVDKKRRRIGFIQNEDNSNNQ